MCYPMGCGQVRPLTKQGTPKFVTEAHYILATISLKFRARITKFQGDVPKALKHGISLVRLTYARTMAHLAAAERILKEIFSPSARTREKGRRANTDVETQA
jgi:hypothetical protein